MIWPGRPFPLGATWDGEGTNFSFFSENAERVELCLFDADGREQRYELTQRTAFNWHGYLPGVGPGPALRPARARPLRARARASLQPRQAAARPLREGDRRRRALGGGEHAARTGPARRAPTRWPTAPTTRPRCRAASSIDPGFDWEGDRRLETPWHETVIYELHVKGFTRLHPGVREDLRGTYAGLASDAAIGYLKSLGVTAVELLPVHHIIEERFLHERGLTNYWGYSSIGYLAPHAALRRDGRRRASRSRSSRAWSRRCTAPASR